MGSRFLETILVSLRDWVESDSSDVTDNLITRHKKLYVNTIDHNYGVVLTQKQTGQFSTEYEICLAWFEEPCDNVVLTEQARVYI